MKASIAVNLTVADFQRLRRFRISDDLIELHEIRRVTSAEARIDCGIQYKGDLSGVAWPIWGADGTIKGHRDRRDNFERENGKPKSKYVQSVDRPHLFFEKTSRQHLSDTSVPAVFVEAYSSALALAAWCERTGKQYLIVATAGCWGWRGTIGKTDNENGARVDEKGPSSDLEHITWTARAAVILFDSNLQSNPKVQQACRAFSRDLQNRGATVTVAALPEEPNLNGPDDYLAIHTDDDLAVILAAAGPVDPHEDTLRELAALSAIEYDQRREETAKTLGIRVSTLDSEVDKLRPKSVEAGTGKGGRTILLEDPEPWPDAVDLAELLATISATFKRFVVIGKAEALAVTMWVALTYVFDSFDICPILTFSSPLPGCGKTTSLEVLTTLVPRPLPTSNLSSSVVYRGIEKYRPVLLLDEADSFMTEDAESLRGIIDSGHRRSTAVVLRNEKVGDSIEPKAFSTWTPKAVAAIGDLPSTIRARSVIIEMRRRTKGEKVERLRFDRLIAEMEPLRRKLARWAQDSKAVLAQADPVLPDGIDSDRAADNWRVLCAIADNAGGPWPADARKAALELCRVKDTDNPADSVQLLSDIRNIFAKRPETEIASADLVTCLVAIEGGLWSEFGKHRKPITARQLAQLLRPFGVTPDSVRFGSSTLKGYKLAQFSDVFSRYVPPSTTGTTEQTNIGAGFSESGIWNTGIDVPDRRAGKPHVNNNVPDVPDRTGVSGEKRRKAAEI